jgi:fermentation-respiration switch protein FrsA (DUF1100 family)
MTLKIVELFLPAYALLVALLYIFQDRLVYYPQIGRDAFPVSSAADVAYEELSLRTEDNESLNAWWLPVAGARGAVLLLPGNAGNLSQRVDYARMFARLGYSTLLIDYRGYGKSTGRPSEQGTYSDADAAWRWLTESRGIDPGGIVIYGESLGGAVAAWLASKYTPRALVLASTFTSIVDLGAELYWFVPVRIISRFKYDTLSRLREVHAPVLVIHSREDQVVPYSHAQRLYAAANEPKTFLEIAGGHNDSAVFMRAEWVDALGSFLERIPRGRVLQTNWAT